MNVISRGDWEHVILSLLTTGIFSHSLWNNSIGDEGAVAIAEAVKTMSNLQTL